MPSCGGSRLRFARSWPLSDSERPGSWHIQLGSIVFAVASGFSLNRTEHSLNSCTGLPRALAAVAFGVLLMIMSYSADGWILFMAACVGKLITVILAVFSSAGPALVLRDCEKAT
jgi:hypothetical protein